MSSYAIGDVQGCFDELKRLLDRLRYDPNVDSLLFLGDLVNRGPQSLEVMRFVLEHQDSVTTVLGNHDLHFLAVALGARSPSGKDTLELLLATPDLPEIVKWLRTRPLFIKRCGYHAVHAGVLPQWTLGQCLGYAAEIEEAMQGPNGLGFLEEMYGDDPLCFSEGLQGYPRLRALTNVFTRIRFCAPDGTLDLRHKGSSAAPPSGMLPWFAHTRATASARILFGHWAALHGEVTQEGLFALDTGCVWGNELTALCLETGELFSCDCSGTQSSYR